MTDNQHSAEYEAYMHSIKWIQKKNHIFRKRGRVCKMCGATDELEVHHKNYDRLGHEIDDDLLIVCKTCHPKADAARVEWEARRVSQIGMAWATLEDVQALTMKLINTAQPNSDANDSDANGT
jgi:hypothetical protein